MLIPRQTLRQTEAAFVQRQAPRPLWPDSFLEFPDAHNARAGFILANGAKSAHSCTMKIIEDVRQQAAEPELSEDEALKKGMEARSNEFVVKGAGVYARA